MLQPPRAVNIPQNESFANPKHSLPPTYPPKSLRRRYPGSKDFLSNIQQLLSINITYPKKSIIMRCHYAVVVVHRFFVVCVLSLPQCLRVGPFDLQHVSDLEEDTA
jgi:hypothetical protein